MTERDPRVDPQPGDRVMKNHKIRNVRKREGGDVTYCLETGGDPRWKNCWITTWQDWCVGAETLERHDVREDRVVRFGRNAL